MDIFQMSGIPGDPLVIGEDTAVSTQPGRWLRRRTKCADGFTLSIQASETHYCSPRENEGPWTAVEVGYPSERPEPWGVWVEYAEDPEIPTGTVYGWVPVALVRQLIDLHGGVK